MSKIGNGRVYGGTLPINCGDTCQQQYDRHTVVALYALPESGHVFAGWSGACTAAAPAPCVLILAADQAVTATFGSPGRSGRHGDNHRRPCSLGECHGGAAHRDRLAVAAGASLISIALTYELRGRPMRP